MEKINGGIPPLHLSGNIYENWRFFIQRFKNYLKATEMDKKNQATQCAQLLHMVGENGFRIYNTFKFEDNEREKIEPLIAKFENYFKPRSNISNVRYNLFTRKQHEGEPIANFITEVTTLAQQCELGDLEDSLIKTCITCGVADERMRQRLLEDDEMTLEKAITLCKSMESSHEQAVKIGTSKNEIHYISKKNFNASRQHRNKMTSQSSANREQRPSSRHRNNINGNRRSKDIPKCYRCGLDHQGQICRAIKAKCNFCNKLGHYSKMCTQKQINVVEKSADESESLFLGLVNNHSDQLGRDDDFENFIINFEVNNKTLKCKLDTGAMANVITKSNLISLKRNVKIQKSNCNLTTFSNDKIAVLGKCNLKCKYEGKYYNIDFYVVDVDAPSIIGLPTCKSLKVIKRIHSLEVNERPPPLMKYDDIKLKYSELFTGIGCLDEPYTIRVDHTVMPVVPPPRKIPLALKDNLKVELDEMEKNQIIEKVDMPTDWVNSLVIVKKPNSNKVRICIDPRDLNRAIKREHFQLPSLDEIAPNLRGNKFFSKLDASKGFWSIKLDEESSNLCTFNTCYGRYKFLRLPYGIKSASEVFHKRFKQIFNMEGVQTYIDDLVVYGSSKLEHDKRLFNVLELAKKHNVKFNAEKCQFGLSRIKFLGFIFDEFGQTVDNEKVLAITNMKTPSNKKDVQRLLGMLTYLSKHIIKLSELTAPLRELIKNDTVWHWDERHDKCFDRIKTVISNVPVLQHFNINKKCTISADCSKDSIGAVLLQAGQPIAYTSKALTLTQRNYAQIEKELLGILVATEKFHNFVYGTNFDIETDHKPLISIVQKPLLSTPPRLQRMLFKLQKYDFNLYYKRGKELYIADTLSRCCAEKPETKSNLDIELESQICLIKLSFNISEVQLNKIIMETKKDVELIMLKSFLKNDWPDETNLSGNLKTLYKIRDEIYYHNGLFLRKNQIIIPKSMYKEMLARIHYGHQGISKSKHLARQSLYWPAMTAHIEDEVKRCKTCARFQNNIREPLISHNIPKLPWEEIGSDLFHIGNDTYLIVVDYYSKYPEICLLKDTDSKTVINHLKSIFARHGIPKVFYSDGGPQYISHEFEIFCKEWEFQSVKSSPQNSKSNGLAERFIQTYKKALQKSYTDRKDTYLTLLQLRNTPINNNLPSPSQLLMSRVLRTNIPTTDKILKPQTFNANKIQANLRNAQTMQKYYYDRGTTKQKPLDNGVNVYIRDKIGIREGVVKNRVRDRTYTVQLQNSNYVNRNRRFLIPIPVDKDNYNDEHQEELFEEEIINDSNSDANKVNEEISPQRTSSGRMVKKPVRLNL
ncbi:uncharacterized protein K02A2.6-like [Photinus pyralis]|uniref:uncharacterized protein K02A2.6-like n=1 Tax=Photinus pyralis TaxID=7054 RepID=UPI00126741E8|nr:uncharacterized protein K02A2.6-like [Photinus pyralis]